MTKFFVIGVKRRTQEEALRDEPLPCQKFFGPCETRFHAISEQARLQRGTEGRKFAEEFRTWVTEESEP
jgi:hypothetical protein